MALVYGQVLGLAVHCGAGAEDHLLHVELHHDLHQEDAPSEVVLVVPQWLLARLSHRLEGSKVNDRGDSAVTGAVLGKHCADVFLHSQINIVQGQSSPRQFLQLADHS